MTASTQIDAKLLKGLKFRTSESREEKDENGKKKMRYIPVERALKPEDVLAWRDAGDAVVIVSKDGTKHKVDKAGAKGGDGGAA